MLQVLRLLQWLQAALLDGMSQNLPQMQYKLGNAALQRHRHMSCIRNALLNIINSTLKSIQFTI